MRLKVEIRQGVATTTAAMRSAPLTAPVGRDPFSRIRPTGASVMPRPLRRPLRGREFLERAFASYGTTASRSSTFFTPGADQAARRASSRSNHACTFPLSVTLPSATATLIRLRVDFGAALQGRFDLTLLKNPGEGGNISAAAGQRAFAFADSCPPSRSRCVARQLLQQIPSGQRSEARSGLMTTRRPRLVEAVVFEAERR